MNIFHGLKMTDDAGLNHLTVSNKALLQCTTLTASQKVTAPLANHQRVQCGTAIVGNLTTSGSVEICNITCPVDFSLTADDDVRISGGDITLSAQGAANGDITLEASGKLDLLGSQVLVAAGAGAPAPAAVDDAVFYAANDMSITGGADLDLTATNVTIIAAPTPLGAGGIASMTGGKGLNLIATEGDLIIEAQDVNTNADVSVTATGNINLSPGTVLGNVGSLNLGVSGGNVGFYGVGGVPQPVPGGTEAAFAAVAGTNVTDVSTFTVNGNAYTLRQVVGALADLGILA
jgi:hypothetical protein